MQRANSNSLHEEALNHLVGELILRLEHSNQCTVIRSTSRVLLVQ